MSLFEQADKYQWRDTWFVWLSSGNRPTAAAVEAALADDNGRHTVENVLADEDGIFESLTIFAAHDGAAMDISVLHGEDIAEAAVDFASEAAADDEDEEEQIRKLMLCDARFEVYHFEEIAEAGADSIDPGALLIVLETLAELCDGVATDPQSGSLF
ncbi:MAG: hypothetical protein NXI22_04195 [bacterium]|nr:hypothetical protein [bacterium]